MHTILFCFFLFLRLQEHIQEVLDKWTQIDDEIWAKVIVFERNRRVAKAYARAPVLTINGSDDGFDGMRYVHHQYTEHRFHIHPKSSAHYRLLALHRDGSHCVFVCRAL